MPVAPLSAGALAQSGSVRATLSVGTSVVTATPQAGAWAWLKVVNLHATAVLTVALNENPTVSTGDPPSAVQWGVGYDVPGGGSELIPVSGTLTTIRLKSDTAATPVVLNLVA